MGGNCVIPVGVEALASIARLNICGEARLHLGDHVGVDFGRVDSHFPPKAGDFDGYRMRVFEPRVRRYLLEPITKFRVRHQNILNQISNFTAQITSEFIVGAENLLVQTLCIVVLEG